MRFRKILSLLLAMTMLFSCVGITAMAEETASSLTFDEIENAYLITSVEDFIKFRNDVNTGIDYAGQTVKLSKSIDLSGEENWTPIGNGTRSSKTYTGNSFKGVFDGVNYIISGLNITSSGGEDAAIGLFGVVDGGTVKNLNLTDVNINVTTSKLAGGAIGLMVEGATAENITVSGAITGYDGVGGIVGRMIISGTITGCTNNASVTSPYGGIGGIVGKAYYEDNTNTELFSSITNCTNNGTITAPMYVGGIVGLARSNVTGCTNNGPVVGGTQTGGIVGQLISAGIVSDNENKAKITGKNHMGGIIGDYTQSSAYSYYDVTIKDNINSGELVATEQCAAIMGCNNIDGFTEMVASGNVSYYNAEGMELFGNPEDMVIDDTNKFVAVVAKIGETSYATLKEAIEAAVEGDTIQLVEGATIEEGEIAIPDVFKNITIKGAEGASLKNTHLVRRTGGATIEGLTIDGVLFDNSHIMVVAWDNATSLKDWTIINSTFSKNDDTSEAPLHMNVGTSVALENLTFKNNIVKDIVGGSKSGIYGQYTGDIVIENNLFDNIAFRPYVIQLTSDDNIADSLVVTGNTFSGSAAGRAQALTNNAEGTDAVELVVNSNIFKDITDAQQICYWNFNPETTTADFSKNYYDIDLEANPSRIYFNSAAGSAEDLVEMGIYPRYTELNADGTINLESEYRYVPVLAKIGDTGYTSVAAALEAAKAAGMTDVTITLVGETTKESAKALDDSFDLYTEQVFDSVTFKQEDSSVPYYIAGIYTGSRTNGGTFVFDGVNIVVIDQYILEGNVKLINNSVVKSVAEANCFIYNGETTIEPGSKIYGVIEDFRGGDLIIDGGRTDGGFNETPDMQDSIMHIRWSGDSLTVKNGAYLKINAVNEIGRLNLAAGTSLNVSASKVEAWEYISNAGTINIDVNSTITTKKITGSGKIVIDASEFDGESVTLINADMSEFTGTVETANNSDVECKIEDGKLIIAAKNVATVTDSAGNVTTYTDIQEALKALKANDTLTLLDDITIDYYWDARYTGGKITVPVTIDGNEHTMTFTNTVYDGGNQYSVFRFESDATVKNLTIDMKDAISGFGGRFRAISAKGDLTVDNCTFIGNGSANNTRAIIFGEGAGAAISDVEVSVTNSTFTGWRRGVSDNENAQDAKSVVVTGNTFTDAGVALSAIDVITFTGNTVTGKYISIKSYTDSENLVVTATGNTLTENVDENNQNYIDVASKNVTAQDEFYIPFDAVAEVNGVGYETLGDAIIAAAPNGTVEILSDIEVDKWVMFSQTKTIGGDTLITLDMNGLTINGNDHTLTVKAVESATNGDYLFDNADNIIINNLTVTLPAESNGLVGGSGGTLTNVNINGGSYSLTVSKTKDLTIKNCTFTKESGTAIYTPGDGDNPKDTPYTSTLTIDGCTFNVATAGDGYAVILRGENDVFTNNVTNNKVNVLGENVTLTGNTFNARLKFYPSNPTVKDNKILGTVDYDAGTESIELSRNYWGENMDEATILTKVGAKGSVSSYYAAVKEDGTLDKLLATSSAELPEAEVKNLGMISVGNNEGEYQFDGSYFVYDLIGTNGGGLSSATEPFDLNIAMQFISKDEPEEAKANAYAEYTTDFFIEIDGLANGSFVGNDCYLAGYYPSFGAWVKIPLDGFTVESGVVYPVISSAGFDFSYVAICESVENFICGIYLTPEIIAENPDIKVNLTLGLSESLEAAQNADFETVDDYTYTEKDFKAVASIGTKKYSSLQKALDAAEEGDTVTVISDVEMTNSVVISGKAVTLNLGEYTIYDKNSDVITSEDDIWGLIALENGAKLTICGNGTIDCNYTPTESGWTGMAYAIDVDATSELIVNSGCITNSNGGIQTYGKVTVNNGTFVSHNGGTCIMAVGSSANVTVNDGVFKDSVEDDDVYTGSGAVWAGFGATININGGTYDFAADPEHDNIVWTLFPAQNAISGYGSNANMTVSGGTFVNFNPATDVVIDYSSSTGFTFGGVVAENYEVVENADGTYGVVKSVEKFEFYTTTVTLANSLAINFYVKRDYIESEGCYAVVEHDLADGTTKSIEIPYEQWGTKSDGYYAITYSGLVAVQMADEIRVAIYNSNGIQISEKKVDGIRAYAIRGFNKFTDPALLTALADMLNYGAAAQIKFNYNVDDLATAGAENFIAQYESQEITVENIQEKGENYLTTTLSLENNILLTGYFRMNDITGKSATIEYVDIYDRSHSTTVTSDKFVKNSETIYGICVGDLAIADAGCAITITVYNQDGTVYGSLVDSMNSYLYRIMQKDDSDIYKMVAKFTSSAAKTLN